MAVTSSRAALTLPPSLPFLPFLPFPPFPPFLPRGVQKNATWPDDWTMSLGRLARY